MRRSSRRAAAEASIALGGRNAGESNKRPRRTVSRGNAAGVKQEQTDNKPDIRLNHYSSEDIPSAAADPAGITPKSLERVTVSEDVEDTQQGPSAYELARLENIKRNAMVMASLGLSTMSGEMRNSVDAEAAQRARARGLKNSSKKAEKPKLERTRQSARVRGKTPEGLPMDDPEEAFLRQKQGFRLPVPTARTSSRISGDVSMSPSNASADGTLRLREMMGGLIGRYGVEGEDEDFELGKPDETLSRLRKLKLEETSVCKVVQERAYSVAWHPAESKLLLATGDKVGNVGLWVVDNSVAADGDKSEDDGVYQFKPHTGAVARLAFDPLDGNKLLSTSYDGTVRRMDVEKGAFEQVYANDISDSVILTYSHLLREERTLMLSDGDGDVTAVDLRTNKQIWKREAHEKKANTVHAHPTDRHLFVTASLDRSVKLWDARNLGAGYGDMKPLVTMPHFRSVNSAHFSPRGEWLVTVGQDDKLKLFQDLARASGPQAAPRHTLPHNNQTGRWLTKFQACWDPKAQGLFAIGSMQKAPHGIHLYSVSAGAKKPSAVELTGGDIMTSIQSVLDFHPKRDVVAAVNASGRAHIFM